MFDDEIYRLYMFFGGNQALMEKGRKIIKPPHEDILLHGKSKLNDHWYRCATIPTDRTTCRRHRLIKWSNFCEDNIRIFATEHLHSRHEQRGRDPEKKASSLIFTATPLPQAPSTPSSITIFIVFERD